LLSRARATNALRADFSESLQDWLRVLQQESRGKYELEYRCWKRIIYSTLPKLDILFNEQDEAVQALQLSFRQKRREEAEAREREEAEAREREEAQAAGSLPCMFVQLTLEHQTQVLSFQSTCS
jgi:hypothetical protein